MLALFIINSAREELKSVMTGVSRYTLHRHVIVMNVLSNLDNSNADF